MGLVIQHVQSKQDETGIYPKVHVAECREPLTGPESVGDETQTLETLRKSKRWEEKRVRGKGN